MIRRITGWIILVTIAIWGGWDVYAYFSEENSTISVFITDLSLYSPAIPLGFGILVGHWFFPARGSNG